MRFWLGALFVSTLAVACATSPTGRSQLVLLPANQMDAMGVEAFQQMKANESTLDSGEWVQYAQCLSQSILAATGLDQDQSWEVVVFDSDQVNAFALPGGKIGIYMGMMRFAENASQLAAVVGHEIGHVVAQHGNERVSSSVIAEGITAAIADITNAQENATGQAIMAGLGLGYQFGISLPHSRTQEEEADVIGLEMMAKAGFDPSQAVQLWLQMAERGQSVPEFLSTHPDPSRRAKYLESMQDKVADEVQAAKAAGRNPSCTKPGM